MRNAIVLYLHQLINNPVASVSVVEQRYSIRTTSHIVSINICSTSEHVL